LKDHEIPYDTSGGSGPFKAYLKYEFEALIYIVGYLKDEWKDMRLRPKFS